MTKVSLDKIKKQLLQEKKKLEEEVNRLTQHGKRRLRIKFTDFGSKDDENAYEVSDLSDKVSLEGELERGLQRVEKALDRIKKGKCGICEECGKEIDEERLKIFPAAILCIECGKKSDKR